MDDEVAAHAHLSVAARLRVRAPHREVEDSISPVSRTYKRTFDAPLPVIRSPPQFRKRTRPPPYHRSSGNELIATMRSMTGKGYEGQDCSIAQALGVVGERWTLLIVRDAFYGV